MSDTTPRPDVVIVGGGIGGLGAALALSRKGLNVRVVERASEFGEVGAGMQIAPNCTRILHEYGLLDEARRLGVLPESMVMKDALDASELTRLDLRDLERRYGFPYMVIHRSDLHGILLRACQRAGVDLVTDRAVVGYENVATGARALCADGHVEEAEVVIAADGLHSVARRLLVDDEPVSSAYVAYRGAVPIEQVRENDVSDTDVVVTSVRSATSSSTPCGAERCSTRSRSSSRPWRSPARRTGAPPMSSTRPSPPPASRSSRGCR
jgi:2-polyprenyl-6-methoxyphenol hydroxylase-like FAD-dependent oxidoreductase